MGKLAAGSQRTTGEAFLVHSTLERGRAATIPRRETEAVSRGAPTTGKTRVIAEEAGWGVEG